MDHSDIEELHAYLKLVEELFLPSPLNSSLAFTEDFNRLWFDLPQFPDFNSSVADPRSFEFTTRVSFPSSSSCTETAGGWFSRHRWFLGSVCIGAIGVGLWTGYRATMSKSRGSRRGLLHCMTLSNDVSVKRKRVVGK